MSRRVSKTKQFLLAETKVVDSPFKLSKNLINRNLTLGKSEADEKFSKEHGVVALKAKGFAKLAYAKGIQRGEKELVLDMRPGPLGYFSDGKFFEEMKSLILDDDYMQSSKKKTLDFFAKELNINIEDGYSDPSLLFNQFIDRFFFRFFDLTLAYMNIYRLAGEYTFVGRSKDEHPFIADIKRNIYRKDRLFSGKIDSLLIFGNNGRALDLYFTKLAFEVWKICEKSLPHPFFPFMCSGGMKSMVNDFVVNKSARDQLNTIGKETSLLKRWSFIEMDEKKLKMRVVETKNKKRKIVTQDTSLPIFLFIGQYNVKNALPSSWDDAMANFHSAPSYEDKYHDVLLYNMFCYIISELVDYMKELRAGSAAASSSSASATTSKFSEGILTKLKKSDAIRITYDLIMNHLRTQKEKGFIYEESFEKYYKNHEDGQYQKYPDFNTQMNMFLTEQPIDAQLTFPQFSPDQQIETTTTSAAAASPKQTIESSAAVAGTSSSVRDSNDSDQTYEDALFDALFGGK